jgi:hypothetical protein
MRGLSAPDMRNTIVTRSGYNSDIIEALNSRFPLALEQSKNVRFSGGTLLEKGRAIYNYLKNTVAYKKDDPGKQVIQLPSRMILDTKSADCKSLALASAVFMANNGFKNVALRYASYQANDPTPTHVYAVGYDQGGNEIIIDPVYKQFNKQVPYQHKIDYPMQISVLSGVNDSRPAVIKRPMDPVKRANILLTKVKPGGLVANVLKNYINQANPLYRPVMRYNEMQLAQYAKRLNKLLLKGKIPAFVANLISAEIKAIQNRQFAGIIITEGSAEINGIREDIGRLSLKKIGKKLKRAVKKLSPKNLLKGVKTVGLVVPRKAFLSMVALNVRGIASRLSKLNTDDLKKLWVDRFGGKLSVLQGAISRGKGKRPLFGASKKVRAIKGIGYVVDDAGNDIGVEPATTAAIIAAAAPIAISFIKLLKGKGVPDVAESAENPGESGDFPEAEGLAQDQKGGILDYISKATEIARETGIIPDAPLNANNAKVDAAIPGDDYNDMLEKPAAPGTGFKINPLILVGAAAGAYLLLRKK